jgi:hypothetical protein
MNSFSNSAPRLSQRAFGCWRSAPAGHFASAIYAKHWANPSRVFRAI